MKRVVVFFILLFAAAVFAEDDFPRPTGFVNDSADILTSAEENTITEIAEALERDTDSEIAVVTVRTVKPQTIEEYSVKLFSKWGIGKRDKNNGVLLLVSVDDREVKIEVGYGLEGILPDGKCGEIIRRYIIPEFKNGHYGDGIIAGVSEIAGVISGKRIGRAGVAQIPTPMPEIVTEIKDSAFLFIVILIIFSFIVLGILQSRILSRRHWSGHHGGWTGSCGSYGSGGFGGGGFGGFGGGSSGGGGAVGRW